MPLIKLLEIPGESKLGVWQSDEPDEFYLKHLIINQYDEEVLKTRSHPLKRKEWLVSRFLLKLLLNVKSELVLKSDGNGKPALLNHPARLSLSHSNGYAAVITSLKYNVSVDIEKVHPKILRIANRFTHADELQFSTGFEENFFYTLVWSVKETVFKLFPDDHLPFKEGIRITTMRFENGRGHCLVDAHRLNGLKRIKVKAELLQNDFILTYAYV